MPAGEMKFGIKGVAGDGDAEPSAACGGCSEAEHPQRSKKSSKQANSAKIFSGTARRQGLQLAEEDEKPGSQGESVGLRLAEALGE